jgi:ankyrin repeat protein
MSENMAAEIDRALAENLNLVDRIDENGWTMLQYEALAGNLTPVKLLLKHGADRTIENPERLRAIELAEIRKWHKITDLLR